MSTRPSSPNTSAAATVAPSNSTTPSVLKASAAEFRPSSSSNFTDSPQLLNTRPHNRPPYQPQYSSIGSPFGGYPDPMMYSHHQPGHYDQPQPRTGYSVPTPPTYFPPQPPLAPWHSAHNSFLPAPNDYTSHNQYNYINSNDPFANQMRGIQDVRNGTVNNTTFNNNVYGGPGQWKKKGKKSKKNRKNRNQQRVLGNGIGMGGEQADGAVGAEHDDEAHAASNGEANVERNGEAHVRSNGGASVERYGEAHVESNGEASVERNGEAHVESNGDAKVEYKNEAHIESNGEAQVEHNGEHYGEHHGENHGKDHVKSNGEVEQNGKHNGELDGVNRVEHDCEDKCHCNGDDEAKCFCNGKDEAKCPCHGEGNCKCNGKAKQNGKQNGRQNDTFDMSIFFPKTKHEEA